MITDLCITVAAGDHLTRICSRNCSVVRLRKLDLFNFVSLSVEDDCIETLIAKYRLNLVVDRVGNFGKVAK